MINSMTTFSRKTEQTPYGQLTWEVRSVNHRYLELGLRLPEPLRAFEKKVRDLVGAQLKRGKVDIFLKFQPGANVPFEMSVNEGMIEQLAAARKGIAKHFSEVEIDLTSLLSWPGVLETKNTHMEELGLSALALLEATLTDAVLMREREGAGIERFLEERLSVILDEVAIVEKQLPQAQRAAREKILTRFQELSIEPNLERVEQEMVYLLQKMDVAEELQRLLAHIEEVRRVLKKGGTVGRRLDFLMQELNREANTLGSKSSDSRITQSVVEIKVQIEQMREQVQNIE